VLDTDVLLDVSVLSVVSEDAKLNVVLQCAFVHVVGFEGAMFDVVSENDVVLDIFLDDVIVLSIVFDGAMFNVVFESVLGIGVDVISILCVVLSDIDVLLGVVVVRVISGDGIYNVVSFIGMFEFVSDIFVVISFVSDEVVGLDGIVDAIEFDDGMSDIVLDCVIFIDDVE
jgi:hypothetical protein